MEQRYSVLPYLKERLKRTGRQLKFSADSREEMEVWRNRLSNKMRELSGYDTMLHAPLNPILSEEKEFDGYTRQHVVIQTEPDVYMPMYVLIPKKGKGPFPAVIAAHGHHSGGKMATAHCDEDPEVASAIALYNYKYGMQFVESGFIVFCPDARGFGERREPFRKEGLLDSSCEILNHMAYPLGQTVIGMWTWDLHRLVDYIQSRPDCLPDQIGCAGLSGGGLQTLWATALDDRIKCAIISGYFYGFEQALLEMPENCSCNYVPRLFEYADVGDIAALIAPRALMIETGTKDPLNGSGGIANVTSQLEVTRRAYKLMGREEQVKHAVFEGNHLWKGEEAVPWMENHLK